MSKPIRIAMWSGPRNLSTAMMRSFSSRPDTAVLDEPFYANYLSHTGIDHPGREKIIAAYENDWEKVIEFISGPIPGGSNGAGSNGGSSNGGGKSVWYQKHMAHHMLPHIDSQRLIDHDALTHAFLIRDPAEVINSYTKVFAEMTLAETGLPYQVDLFERVKKRTGKTPPVIDARDVLTDPRRTLAQLCLALGIQFTDRMLQWPKGAHADDGNWGAHWYANVNGSTSFEKYRPRHAVVAERFQPMFEEARKLYDQLSAHTL
jgi:hypothetical protein